jgi:PAS domain S-box-containing protein
MHNIRPKVSNAISEGARERKHERARVSRYLVAILAPFAIAGVTQISWPFFERGPFFLFLLAVMVAAWYGGIGPGLVSMLVGFFLADYLFIQPYFHFWPGHPGDISYLVALLLVGAGISSLAEVMHRAHRQTVASLSSTKNSESRMRGVVDSAIDAIVTVGHDHRILVFNHAAEKLFLCPAANALGQPLDRFIPERFEAAYANHLETFGQNGGSPSAMAGTGAVYGLRSDGTEVSVEASISRTEENGEKLYTVIMRDITERQRAEDRFRQVIEHAPNGMVMVDERGQITLVNAQVESSFGYPREELIGQPIEVLVPERFHLPYPELHDGIVAHPPSRPRRSARDLYGLRKDGSEFPVEIGLNPIETEAGTMVLGTIVDITERKAAELALVRLAEMVDSSHDAIIGKNLDSIITSWNRGAEEIFGYAASEIIGSSIMLLIPADGQAQERKILARIKRGESVQHFEAVRLTKGGGLIQVSVMVSPIMNNDGVVVGVSKVARDISARKRSEEALNEQARILDLAPVLIKDLDDRIVFWNTGAEQMYGWTGEEALGRISHELFRTEFPVPRTQINTELFSQGHWEGELVHIRRDGRRVIVASHWVVHRDADGQPKAILEVNTDLTERRQAEAAGRTSEGRYRTLFDYAPDGIVIADHDSHYLDVNPSMCRMMGYSREEFIGLHASDIVDPAEFPHIGPALAAIKAAPDYHQEWLFQRKEGSTFPAEVIATLMPDGNILGVIRDITERKQAEEAIHQLNLGLEQRVNDRTVQLRALNKELEAFSYSVSHDLRAPLRHINGFSQALLEDYGDQLDDTGKGLLQEVRAASQEMAQLIDDVLQLARVSRGEMRNEMVDLSALAHEVIAELRRQEPGRKVEVQIGEGLVAQGDKRLLKITLANLLRNAWKFSSKCAHAAIEFGPEQRDGERVYFVRDNGAGFDMAFVSKLFGAFQRLHSAKEFEGTGVGLATVQRIVHRHQGRVWADAAVGRGATFYFTLGGAWEEEHG